MADSQPQRLHTALIVLRDLQIAIYRTALLSADIEREVAHSRTRIALAYRRMAAAGGPHAQHYRRRAETFDQLAVRAWRFAQQELAYTARAVQDFTSYDAPFGPERQPINPLPRAPAGLRSGNE